MRPLYIRKLVKFATANLQCRFEGGVKKYTIASKISIIASERVIEQVHLGQAKLLPALPAADSPHTVSIQPSPFDLQHTGHRPVAHVQCRDTFSRARLPYGIRRAWHTQKIPIF